MPFLSSDSPNIFNLRTRTANVDSGIFGGYISQYNFKRSEEDGSTFKLVYENREEKLGVARKDLNSKIAAKIEEAELDQDQTALFKKLLGNLNPHETEKI
jgi:type I site-specific restriction-modification system R (restriction) subunit